MWTMRTIFAITMILGACDSGEKAGVEAAKRQAAEDMKAKEASGGVAKKISPPVPGRAKLDCATLIDAAKFQQTLGEAQPVTVVPSALEADAAASCSINRGGKRPTEGEQKAAIKANGRLGVLPGDEICNVSTFCWTIEEPDRFAKKCLDDKKQKMDSSLGFPACVYTVATGEDDVNHWRFFDDDTKCIIQVRSGPSNVDNDLIGKCAKAAHDQIGPDQIKPAAGSAN